MVKFNPDGSYEDVEKPYADIYDQYKKKTISFETAIRKIQRHVAVIDTLDEYLSTYKKADMDDVQYVPFGMLVEAYDAEIITAEYYIRQIVDEERYFRDPKNWKYWDEIITKARMKALEER
jgi:hypothetical protein